MEQEKQPHRNDPSLTYEQMLEELKKQHALEMSKLRDFYEKKLLDHDPKIKHAVSEEGKRIKRSWTWRIGSLMVAPAVAAAGVLKVILDLLSVKRIKSVPTAPKFNPANQEPGQIEPQKLVGTVDNELVIDPDKANIGCVFDTFTYNCYRYEFNCIRPSPETWNKVFSANPPSALFVESAWRGNENTWQNQIGKFSNTSEINLNALLHWCKSKDIPTIFWNKEDPVHYDYFIKDAKKFDFIFTTDEGVVAKYQADSLNDKVFPLPFAAQPMIHNPVKDVPRDGSACFAGTYYNQRYVERKGDMEILLRPALDFGLEIYDRNFGVEGMAAEQYRFPDIYQPVIKGRLDYGDMIKAYKKYKVFLNVNSVRNSTTMFARRVFELLASGTPVISTYSRGIVEILGEGTVLLTDSEAETKAHLQNLLSDEQYWWRISLAGMRKVLESHTYTNRTQEVFARVGLQFREPDPVRFAIVSMVGSLHEAEYIGKILRCQTWTHSELLIMPAVNFTINDMIAERLREIFTFIKMEIAVAKPAKVFRDLSFKKGVQYVALMDGNHYYGKNYLKDFALAIAYSKAEVLGKNMWITMNKGKEFKFENRGSDFRYVSNVQAGTLVIKREKLINIDLSNNHKKALFSTDGDKLLSVDPYNFLENGRLHYELNASEIVEKIDM
jgi:spore maturation protein CgeB